MHSPKGYDVFGRKGTSSWSLLQLYTSIRDFSMRGGAAQPLAAGRIRPFLPVRRWVVSRISRDCASTFATSLRRDYWVALSPSAAAVAHAWYSLRAPRLARPIHPPDPVCCRAAPRCEDDWRFAKSATDLVGVCVRPGRARVATPTDTAHAGGQPFFEITLDTSTYPFISSPFLKTHSPTVGIRHPTSAI